mgnify:CR=1 FL=1
MRGRESTMKSDIEICQETNLRPINEIAKSIGIDEEYLEAYGKYKAKIDYLRLAKGKGKENSFSLRQSRRRPQAKEKPRRPSDLPTGLNV